MRAFVVCTLLVVGCGGNQPMMALVFNGNWSGTLMHPAANCTDGSMKPAFSATTSFQINEDQSGLFLIWQDRCPLAGNIAFEVDTTGTARQQADVLCENTSAAQATFSSGVMTVAGNTLTVNINETEHDTGPQTRDCEWPMTAMMTRQ